MKTKASKKLFSANSYLISLPQVKSFMEIKSVENRKLNNHVSVKEKLFLSSFYINIIAYSFLRLCASKNNWEERLFITIVLLCLLNCQKAFWDNFIILQLLLFSWRWNRIWQNGLVRSTCLIKCNNGFWPLHIPTIQEEESTVSKLIQTLPNFSKRLQTLLKPYPTGPNLSQPILIHPNPVQTYQTPHHAEVPNSGKILVYCSQIIEKNWKNVDLR